MSESSSDQIVRQQQPEHDPVLQGERADRVSHFEALGFTVRVETNDERVERAAATVFKPQDGEIKGDGREVVIRLLVHDVPESESWRPVQPVFRAQGRYFYIAASNASALTGDVEERFAFGFISDRQASHTDHLRSALIQAPFLWMTSGESLAAVHCAVLSLNGTAIMVRGEQNAGKSTLAYAALCEGFSLLCEDVAFAFGREDGLIELRGLPWLLYLKPDATRFFPELTGVGPVERYNGETKLPVEVAASFPGQTIETAPVGPTVFLNRSPEGDNRLVELDEVEAQARLAGTRIPFEEAEAEGFAIWGAMLAQPCYRFDVGPDPRAAARALRVLCAT